MWSWGRCRARCNVRSPAARLRVTLAMRLMRKAVRPSNGHVGAALSTDKLVWTPAQAQQTRRIGDRDWTRWRVARRAMKPSGRTITAPLSLIPYAAANLSDEIT